ncbi:Facilitated trehalose transporter Tret1 [Papilio xuthus]|uniref:Facilitated trehalose transporter Tret1 n=1 Tax=Papilio xuthus TaxID=66420 RepID=A0A194QJ47_PAPXU|nr:Facilitated trehalose transporter Tret1 [Papilio xuthus]
MLSGSQVMTFCYVLLPQLNAVSHLNDEQASWIASINGIALPIGLLVTTPIMNKYGRKPTNIIRAILITAAWTCLSLTTDYYVILFCRFLQGICLGCAAILVPVLLGEYASPKYRGACLTTIAISISLGVLSIHTLSFLTWHYISIICAAISLLNIIIAIFSPESPSFLAKKGKYDECRRIFNWLRYPNEVQELEKMIQIQMSAVNRKKKESFKKIVRDFFNMWKKKEVYKPLFLMFHLHIINEWCAANVHDAFTTYIYKRVIGDIEISLLISTDILRALSAVCAFIIVRKLKRRLMLLLTVLLNIISLLILSIYVYLKMNSLLSFDHPYIGVFLIHFYVFSFSSGCLVLPNILSGEIFPLQYREVCQIIAQLFFSINLIINMKTALQMFNVLELYGSLLVYAGLVTYGLLISLIILPETKDKTLQDIEEEFKGLRDRELSNLLID